MFEINSIETGPLFSSATPLLDTPRTQHEPESRGGACFLLPSCVVARPYKIMAQVAPNEASVRYLDRGKVATPATKTEQGVTFEANTPQIERTASINSISSNSQNRWVSEDPNGSPSRGVQLAELKNMAPTDRLLLRDAQKLSVRREMRRAGSFSSLSSSSSKSSKRGAGAAPLIKAPSLIKIASGGFRKIMVFSVAITGRLKRSLQKNKKVKALISRLWRECVINVYLYRGTWMLEDYMDCAHNAASTPCRRPCAFRSPCPLGIVVGSCHLTSAIAPPTLCSGPALARARRPPLPLLLPRAARQSRLLCGERLCGQHRRGLGDGDGRLGVGH